MIFLFSVRKDTIVKGDSRIAHSKFAYDAQNTAVYRVFYLQPEEQKAKRVGGITLFELFLNHTLFVIALIYKIFKKIYDF